MPYIKQEDRVCLHFEPSDTPQNAGELNYVFTKIACEYLHDNTNYQRINDIIGALEGCKLELYRRVASPYEDSKIQENGDVYE